MIYAAVPQMHRTRRQVRRWSVGHDAPSELRCDKSRPVPCPWRVGALTPLTTEMAILATSNGSAAAEFAGTNFEPGALNGRPTGRGAALRCLSALCLMSLTAWTRPRKLAL